MAQRAESSEVFDTVWVGDSLLAKPRLESVTLLFALAAVTSKVRLAVGAWLRLFIGTRFFLPSNGRVWT